MGCTCMGLSIEGWLNLHPRHIVVSLFRYRAHTWHPQPIEIIPRVRRRTRACSANIIRTSIIASRWSNVRRERIGAPSHSSWHRATSIYGMYVLYLPLCLSLSLPRNPLALRYVRHAKCTTDNDVCLLRGNASRSIVKCAIRPSVAVIRLQTEKIPTHVCVC